MKKAVCLLALLGLVSLAVVFAAEKASAPAPESSETAAQVQALPAVEVAAETPDSSCNGTSADADESIRSYIGELEFQAVGTLPACPSIQTCTGGNFECGGSVGCGAHLTIRDTGWSACDTLTCPFGQTVHIEAGPCNYCPCCSTIPACVCPAPSIGCGKRAVKTVFCQ